MKNDFNNLYETYIKTRAKLTDYEKLLSNIDKFHVKLSDLHQKIKNIINNTHNLQKEIKKINKPTNTKIQFKFNILTFDKVQSLQNKIRNNSASFPEGELLIKNYDTSLENISKLKKMINDPQSDLYEMISLKDEIIIHNLEEEDEINKVIWDKKYNYLILSGKKPNPIMIEHLIYEAKEFGINDNKKLTNLKALNEESTNLIYKIKKCYNEKLLEDIKPLVEQSNIDLNDILIEQSIEIKLDENDNKNKEKKIENKELNLQNKSSDIKPINENKTEKIYSKKNLDEDEDYDEENSFEDKKLYKSKTKLNKADALKKFSKDLLEDAENFTNVRGKRNIKRRFDKDFVYETEFVEEFNNKIAKRDEDEVMKKMKKKKKKKLLKIMKKKEKKKKK